MSLVNSPGQTPLLLFVLSDSAERSNSFLSKIFPKELLSLKDTKFNVLSLNPPTEKNIIKVMRAIIVSEEIDIADSKLEDIKN